MTLVLLADQGPAAVAASLDAHVAAAGAVEGHGYDVDAVLVQCAPERRTRALLDAVEGAVVAPMGGYDAPGAAWDAGCAVRTRPDGPDDLVYLCSAGSAPAPDALAQLVLGLAATEGCMVAVPGSRAPLGALVRRRLLAEVDGFAGLGLARVSTVVMALTRFTHLLGRSVRPPLVVTDADVGGVPVCQRPRVARSGWRRGTFQVAHPDAVTVGAHTYLTKDSRCVTLSPLQRIEIGSFCSIADEVRLLHPSPVEDVAHHPGGGAVPFRIGGLHRMECATTFPLGRFPGLEWDVPHGEELTSRQLVIGHDVWLGYRSMVLGPVTIGHGAVVGAGAVVPRDVAPYAVVAGNPARTVRQRFPDHVVEALLRIAWWDWTEQEVFANAAWFAGPIEAFVERFDRVGAARLPA